MTEGNLRELGQNLVLLEPGLWISKAGSTRLSFPEEGHAECYQMEEQSFWFRHRNECIAETLRRYPPPGTLFDVGGGNGYVSLGIKRSGHDAVLVEPAIEGARFGRERGLQPVVCSTVQNAGFKAGSLPAVGIFDVLEHIEDDRRFLIDLHDLLAMDGRLYLTVPAYRWLWSAEDKFAGHFRRYSLTTLCALLKEVGFDVEFQSYIFSILPLPIFLMRSIPGYLGSEATAERHRREHDSSARSAIVEWLLKCELGILRAGHRLPSGSSCLAVATRTRK